MQNRGGGVGIQEICIFKQPWTKSSLVSPNVVLTICSHVWLLPAIQDASMHRYTCIAAHIQIYIYIIYTHTHYICIHANIHTYRHTRMRERNPFRAQRPCASWDFQDLGTMGAGEEAYSWHPPTVTLQLGPWFGLFLGLLYQSKKLGCFLSTYCGPRGQIFHISS